MDLKNINDYTKFLNNNVKNISNKPKLVDGGVKYFFKNMLKECNKYKQNNSNQISDITETLLFLTSRSDLVNKKLLPKLEKNESYIICDRFLDSTLAYQAYGRGVDLDLINSITNAVVETVVPSTTFVGKLISDIIKGI